MHLVLTIHNKYCWSCRVCSCTCVYAYDDGDDATCRDAVDRGVLDMSLQSVRSHIVVLTLNELLNLVWF